MASKSEYFPPGVVANVKTDIKITDLPLELFQQILGHFPFGYISKLRLVSKKIKYLRGKT